MCHFTVSSLIASALAISLFGRPMLSSLRIWVSLGVRNWPPRTSDRPVAAEDDETPSPEARYRLRAAQSW